MIERLRQVILKLNVASERRQSVELGRKALAMAAKLTRSTPAKAEEKLAGLAATIQLHQDEVSTWVPSSTLAAGEGGAFDTCDLRHWLALAERAGVPYVPAREIVTLSDEETAFLSGEVPIPEGKTREDVRMRLIKMAVMKETLSDIDGVPPTPPLDHEALQERLFTAMDGVPEGWMVRSARCGGSELKALAGFGAGGPQVPETRFGPDLEVGPGWVRLGNRRKVHVGDMRTIEAHAQGPGGPLVFLARPWVEAARYAVGEDPHRHGSQFAGKGIWPAEWRAFVEGDVVVGVASYYGWCGSVTQENARIALEVRDLAQRIVDEAVRQRAYPRYMDVEFMRSNEHPQVKANEGIQSALALFARDKVGCTLDFIETAQGPTLLEGGPPNTPFGGGHPCAFAGSGGPPRHGNKTIVHGVAFRLMPDVLLVDPSTWEETDREGCILTWDRVEALAMEGPSP